MTHSAMTVASYNVMNSLKLWPPQRAWAARKAAVVQTIKSLDCQLIGLQEVRRNQLNYLKEALPEFDFYAVGRENGFHRGEHCAIAFARARFVVQEAWTRWFSDNPNIAGSRYTEAPHARIASHVVLTDCWTNRTFSITNVHLENRNAKYRMRSIGQLISWVNPDLPAIITGDMNATIDSAEMKALIEAQFSDTCTTDGSNCVSSHHGFRETGDGSRIDFIFSSRHWTANWAQVKTGKRPATAPSDHWPVVAELTFSN